MLRSISNLKRPSCHILHRVYKSTLEEDYVVPAENNRIFVAWHPERNIPYEHTKPITATRRELAEAAARESTPLQLPNKKLFFNDIRNEVEYLKKITYTNKHRWYPQPKDKRILRRPHDRDGL